MRPTRSKNIFTTPWSAVPANATPQPSTGSSPGPGADPRLIAWGTKFDKTPDGRFELNREGGHTEHRILHHEDLTGAEIERALITSVRKHPNITVLEHHFAIDLLTQHHLANSSPATRAAWPASELTC